MSLKAFHIFFIIASIVLALGFAIWEVNRYTSSGEVLELFAAIVAVLMAIGMIAYGIRFMRKLKNVRMI
ncbi:MAG: hypothetical protein HY961_13835 [Ignavibacteriae bacterium]|nr:hypothetical protein [Ignavibacteriota bacterium]